MIETLSVFGLLIVLVVATWRTKWRQFSVLLSLALLGQKSALAIIDSPNYGVLQHYFPWRELLSSDKAFFLVVPLVQSILTGWGIWHYRHSTARWYARLLSRFQTIVLLGVIAFASANFSRDVFRYGGEVLLSTWIFAINGAGLILAANAIPTDSLNSIAQWFEERIRSLQNKNGRPNDRWGRFTYLAIALWTIVVSTGLAWLVLERIPHIPDSVAFLFQAKYFSIGALYLPVPPEPNAFDVTYVINDGIKWYGYGFPGWPMVLAIGVLTGTPWLVNPVLAGLTVLLSYALLRRLYGNWHALATIVLLAISPWFLFMSASFMTHPVTLVWTLLCLLAVEKLGETGRRRWGFIAGASMGMLFLTRPLEGMAIGLVVGIWILFVRKPRIPLQGVAALGLAAILIGGLTFPYNALLTGKATYFPVERYFDEHWYPGANGLGFGPNKGNVGWDHIDPLPGHGLLDVIVNTNQNLFLLNFETFGWAFGSIIFVLLLILWRRFQRPDWLFLMICASIIAANSLYFYSGAPDFGARYWYQLIVPVVALTVRGIHELQKRWLEHGGTRLATIRMVAFVAIASLIAFVNIMPWRSVNKYYHYRGMRPDIIMLADACEFGESLVFVQEQDKSDYPSAVIFNPPTLNSPETLYARDPGSQDRDTVAGLFPDRPTWIVSGSAELGGSFTVIDSPVSKSQIRETSANPELCR